MLCSRCERTVADDVNFCAYCGKKLKEICVIYIVRLGKNNASVAGNSYLWQFQCMSGIPEDFTVLPYTSKAFVADSLVTTHSEVASRSRIEELRSKLVKAGWKEQSNLADPEKWFSYQFIRAAKP